MGYTGEKKKEYQRQWVAARRAGFFKGKCCVRCGSTESLELDHIDPLSKTHHAIWSWSESRRLVETEKCQILCSSCHMKKSIEQQPITHGWEVYRHGSQHTYDRGCRCDVCKGAKKIKNAKTRANRKARQALIAQ